MTTRKWPVGFHASASAGGRDSAPRAPARAVVDRATLPIARRAWEVPPWRARSRSRPGRCGQVVLMPAVHAREQSAAVLAGLRIRPAAGRAGLRGVKRRHRSPQLGAVQAAFARSRRLLPPPAPEVLHLQPEGLRTAHESSVAGAAPRRLTGEGPGACIGADRGPLRALVRTTSLTRMAQVHLRR